MDRIIRVKNVPKGWMITSVTACRKKGPGMVTDIPHEDVTDYVRALENEVDEHQEQEDGK